MSGAGWFVAVAGPSGAGKDTLLHGVRERLADDPRFVFARRVVTRASGGNEEHDSVSPEVFERMRQEGAFLLSWSANGLSYGLPGRLAEELAGGRIVIANVSRSMLATVKECFGRALLVEITVVPAVLAERLAARGREDAASRAARLARASEIVAQADIRIDNSGPLEGSLQRFEHLLLGLVSPAIDARRGQA